MSTMSLSRFSDIHDLNDEGTQVLQISQISYRQDLAHSNGFPIILQSPYIQKDCELTSDILNNNNRLTFTEFLTDSSEQFINEAYEFAHHQQPHAIAPPTTTCSSPSSDDYSIFNYDETKMIKMEYQEPLENACSYYNMPRSLSVDSSCCPELAAVCNPSNLSTASLSPVQSPLGQSPIMSPCGLPPTPPQQHHQIHTSNLYHHCHEEREIPELVMQAQQPSQTLLMPDQDFQSMVASIPSPASSTKASGKSRGRRMSTKPAKPGTKCFECTYSGCGRVFKRSEHLKRHVRSIHTLERPFHCPYPHCSKRFSRSDNLSQHLRVHRPNGKDKHPTARIINNFTPFLQTYHQNGTIHSSIVN